jgi:hypothetical protein
MAEDGKKSTASKTTPTSGKLSKDAPASYATSTNMDNPESASATPKTPNDPDGPTAEDDRRQLDEQLSPDIARKVDIDKDPAEAQENSADWYEGREPNDVVEVEGQRETVEARMARNGVAAPEKQAGATTKADA